MKRKIILIIALVCVGFISKAQQKIDLGLKIHPVFGWMRPDVGESDGTKLGFSYGVMADFYFRDNYAIGTEFAITSMGGIIKQTEGNTTEVVNYKLNYIELPVTLKLKTNEIGQGKFYGQFGLAPGIKAGAKTKTEVTVSGVTTPTQDNSAGDLITPFRLGLVVGGGYEYTVSDNVRLLGGLTFNNGFTDVLKKGNAKSSYFALNLGVFF